MLSRFGRGDTRVRGSFIVLITDNYDKTAKFILTRNAIYGMFKLQIRLDVIRNLGYDLCDIQGLHTLFSRKT